MGSLRGGRTVQLALPVFGDVTEAIQAGRITVNKKRYHHPDVKISDIIKQKTPIATM